MEGGSSGCIGALGRKRNGKKILGKETLERNNTLDKEGNGGKKRKEDMKQDNVKIKLQLYI